MQAKAGEARKALLKIPLVWCPCAECAEKNAILSDIYNGQTTMEKF